MANVYIIDERAYDKIQDSVEDAEDWLELKVALLLLLRTLADNCVEYD